MKKYTSLLIVFVLAGFYNNVSAQTQQEKISYCEDQASYFKNKIGGTEHAYSYIAHISYVDCLIGQFPKYRQGYIDEQIKPNIRSLKSFGDLSDMPSDAQALLRKYW